MQITHFIADHSVAIGFGTSGSAVAAGVTLANINPYLQAAAFIVAIIAGLCSIADYFHKRMLRKRHDQQSKH